jgi:tellurite methyltransferase
MAATAVEAWDERWATPEGRDDWLVPHPAVAAMVAVLKARGTQRVLDLGCGVGRHALLFAEHGFDVEAIDGAVAGLDFACRQAAARGLRISLRQADADALPFADESFDYVLSWNVIFHGTMGDVGRRLAEIWRVLKPGGLYQGTMLSKRDAQFGRGRPVAPDTFIRGSDPKAHLTLLLRLGRTCRTLRRLRTSVADPGGAAPTRLVALAHPRRTAVNTTGRVGGAARSRRCGGSIFALESNGRSPRANGRYWRREAADGSRSLFDGRCLSRPLAAVAGEGCFGGVDLVKGA